MFTINEEDFAYSGIFSVAYIKTAAAKLLAAQAQVVCAFSKSGFSAEQLVRVNGHLQKQLFLISVIEHLLLHKFEPFADSFGTSALPKTSETPECGDMAKYLFKGRGEWTVQNPEDDYSGGLAVVQLYASDGGEKSKNFLSYSVMKGSKMLIMLASAKRMKPFFTVTPCSKEVNIEGNGFIIIKEQAKPEAKTTGKYALRVSGGPDGGFEKPFFSMRLLSCDRKIEHASGTAEGRNAMLKFELL